MLRAQRWVLVFLPQVAISGNQDIDLCPHKAAECILRRADDRLVTDIEAGIDDHWTSGELLEPAYQCVVSRIRIGVHGLNTGGIVDMRHGGDFRARHIQLFDSE